jgi:rhamnulokinase
MSELYLAFDLGAGTIRTILGRLDDDGHLEISQLRSSPNEIINVTGNLHWDILGIYREVLEGMRLCAAKHTRSPMSLGVDTWGLDFGLFDGRGNLIGLPF